MTDPIADLLTRIRNAQAVSKPEVVLPYSKLKHSVADILHKEGYIAGVERIERGQAEVNYNQLKLTLKYRGPKQPYIQNLKRISKPGRRVYAQKNQLPVVLNNLGIAIISTSQGLMTNKQAKNAGLGGEVLCEIS